MTATGNQVSLRTAALIAGFSILLMAIAAPFAELYVYPRLVVRDDAVETTVNILANKSLFVMGILGYLVTFVCDVVAAWALYVLLRPVNRDVSLLTGCFRLVYGVVSFVALLNLVTLLRVLNTAESLPVFGPDQLHAQVKLSLSAFKSNWSFGILFFGAHLALLGYLVLRSHYIPRILGLLLVISGLGYLVTTLGPYVLPGVDLHIANYTFYGELIFMLWLLIRGWKIHDVNTAV